MLINKVIELMLGEDVEMITEFLGYKPDDEVLNNNQLLEEELDNVARQMPDDVLMKFYEKSQGKLRAEAEKNIACRRLRIFSRKWKTTKTNWNIEVKWIVLFLCLTLR